MRESCQREAGNSIRRRSRIISLELPLLRFHEFFERHTWNAKMPTNVWNLRCVLFEKLHSDYRAALYGCTSDDKWIGVSSAFEKLLLLDILMEVSDAVNTCNESTFRC